MAKFIPDHISNPEVDVDEQESTSESEMADTESNGDNVALAKYLTDLLKDADVDEYYIDYYLENVDYSLPHKQIIDAFKEFIASDRGIVSESKILYPVFVEIKEGEAPIVMRQKPKSEFKVTTASSIIERAERRRNETGIPAGYVPIGAQKSKVSHKDDLKPEEEIPQLVSIDELRSEYIDKMRKGESIECELCGKVILPTEIRGWWLSIYPAHMECIHSELNRRAMRDGRPLPFPE